MSFWNQCWHSKTSDADNHGDAICLGCGAKVRTKLTESNFREFGEQVLRQGYHSMRCVRSDLGWVCADDCPSVKRAAA